jgi:hypothetical protein
VSALEPFEDGFAPFRVRSTFAHREIKPGQSNTPSADSIQSNAGLAIRVLPWNGDRAGPRSEEHTFVWYRRAVMRRLSLGELRRVCGDYATSDGNLHGFFLSGGTFTGYDIPGANADERPLGHVVVDSSLSRQTIFSLLIFRGQPLHRLTESVRRGISLVVSSMLRALPTDS